MDMKVINEAVVDKCDLKDKAKQSIAECNQRDLCVATHG